eukprot:Rhum_TRINITY_DN25178_c0_g1::Rhum_TRINITY_DN25178_c0_g1_i1::g.181408::m.181408
MPSNSDASGYLFMALAVCLITGHWLHVKKPLWVQEAGVSIIVGVVLGWLVGPSGSLGFDEAIFFQYILPPIIFTAGFCCRRKHFFKNLTVILVYGVAGTLMNFLIIAYLVSKVIHLCDIRLHEVEILSLASILSATDSVAVLGVMDPRSHPNLYGVLAGEGILNDAIAIVLFGAVGKTVRELQTVGGVVPTLDLNTALRLSSMFAYVSLCSTLVGIVFGAATSVFFKTLARKGMQMESKREITLLLIVAYTTNFVSTKLALSGILSLFVLGVLMSHYTLYSLSEVSRIPTTHTFESISFGCETFLFISLGYYLMNYPDSQWCFSFLFAVIGVLMVSRGTTVVILSTLLNLLGVKIGWKQSCVMWWAGMIRGALAFALSFDVVSKKSRSLIISTTFGIVMITVFVFGGFSLGFLKILDLPKDVGNHGTEEFWASHHWSLAEWFSSIDDKYIKKVVGGNKRPFNKRQSAPIPETLPLLSPHGEQARMNLHDVAARV